MTRWCEIDWLIVYQPMDCLRTWQRGGRLADAALLLRYPQVAQCKKKSNALPRGTVERLITNLLFYRFSEFNLLMFVPITLFSCVEEVNCPFNRISLTLRKYSTILLHPKFHNEDEMKIEDALGKIGGARSPNWSTFIALISCPYLLERNFQSAHIEE